MVIARADGLAVGALPEAGRAASANDDDKAALRSYREMFAYEGQEGCEEGGIGAFRRDDRAAEGKDCCHAGDDRR